MLVHTCAAAVSPASAVCAGGRTYVREGDFVPGALLEQHLSLVVEQKDGKGPCRAALVGRGEGRRTRGASHGAASRVVATGRGCGSRTCCRGQPPHRPEPGQTATIFGRGEGAGWPVLTMSVRMHMSFIIKSSCVIPSPVQACAIVVVLEISESSKIRISARGKGWRSRTSEAPSPAPFTATPCLLRRPGPPARPGPPETPHSSPRSPRDADALSAQGVGYFSRERGTQVGTSEMREFKELLGEQQRLAEELATTKDRLYSLQARGCGSLASLGDAHAWQRRCWGSRSTI